MEEIWKPIDGYANYEISNLGRVKNITTDYVLKQAYDNNGYKHVVLYDENHVGMTKSVHRMVGLAFIPNPNNLPQINHIDEDRGNNCVDNLEWCTSKENNNHGTHNLKIGLNNPLRRPIYSVDINGNVSYYDSGRAAQRFHAEKGEKILPAGITKALKGHVYTYKNLAWYYQDDPSGITNYKDKFLSPLRNCTHKKIRAEFNNGKVCNFKSILEATKELGIPEGQRGNIRKALNEGIYYLDAKWYYAS